MPSIPPEIIALIVSEIICDSEASLSALASAWKDTVPFIREHRFRTVSIFEPSKMTTFQSIVDGAPGIFTAIRKLLIRCDPTVSHLVSRRFFASITQLTTLSLAYFSAPLLSDLFDILGCSPYLRTLTLVCLEIKELENIALRLWPKRSAAGTPQSVTIPCPPWETREFEVPMPVSQVSSLKIVVLGAPDLLFLDLISGSQTPLPNLQEIVVNGRYLRRCRPRRLPALVERYNTSLRVLDLVVGLEDVPALTLPVTLEHLKCSFHNRTSINLLCQALSSSRATALKVITMRLQVSLAIFPPDCARLDMVLAALKLDRWILEVNLHVEPNAKSVHKYFPRCMERCTDGKVAGGIHWTGEKGQEQVEFVYATCNDRTKLGD